MKKLTKNQKIALVSAGSVVAIGAVYYFLILRPNLKAKKELSKAPEMVYDNVNKDGGDFPLKKGSRGENVKSLQKKLGVITDGIFGVKTEKALLDQIGKNSIDKATFDDFLNTKVKYAAARAMNININK